MELTEKREEEFVKELKMLLKKYKAELKVSNVGLRVYIPSVWEGSELKKKSLSIDLGYHVDGDDDFSNN